MIRFLLARVSVLILALAYVLGLAAASVYLADEYVAAWCAPGVRHGRAGGDRR